MGTTVPLPQDAGALRAALWEALGEVPDPEIPVVSVVDLGMVEGVEADARTGTVRVTLLPTFVGCPALGLIRQGVARRLQAVPGVRQVEVRVTYSPPWSTDRITPEGRRKLASFGIAPPPAPGGPGAPAGHNPTAVEDSGAGGGPVTWVAGGAGAGVDDGRGRLTGDPEMHYTGAGAGADDGPRTGGCRAAQRLGSLIPFPGRVDRETGGNLRGAGGRGAEGGGVEGKGARGAEAQGRGAEGDGGEGAPCPFCGSRRTRRENAFGPTPCRSLWYCLDCRNPFEQMKAL